MRAGKQTMRQGARAGQRRNMGGSAPPPTEGIDGVVRKYFPGDHQLAMAIIGGYFSLYLVSKIVGAVSGGKKEEAAPVTASSASAGEIPSIEDPNFGKWLEGPGNIEKLVNSL
mgnify:CR=1 FL=1